MAKYTVRPIGGLNQLVTRGLAKIYKDNPDGSRDEQGDYNAALLPGCAKTHRVFFDPTTRTYPINGLSHKELNEIAKEMRLVDPKTNQLIETANPLNEQDPFFKHEDLILEIPTGGVVLDDATAEGKYWLAAIRTEPKLFNIDNSTDNPLVKKIQEFKVTTAGHSESEIRDQVREGRRAAAIFTAKQGDIQWLKDMCRMFEIKIGDNVDIETMRDTIYEKITIHKDHKTKDGVRNIDKFLVVNDMPQEAFTTKARIQEAIEKKIIKKEGKIYSFDEVVLGKSVDQVLDFLSKDENTDTKGMIFAAIAEKSAKA